METALLITVAYLLGAVPFGLLIGWARGVDIRALGSHNIGATNAGRVLGRGWGFTCLGLDILKGLSPTLCASLLWADNHSGASQHLLVLAVAVAAVLGHVFPIYLKFRGGKGVATTIGVALGIWPYFTVSMLVTVLAYGLVRFSTGMVSAGSLTLAVMFPVAFLACTRIAGLPMAEYWPLQTVAVLLGLLIIVRHRDNIRRLLSGREMKTRRVPEE